MANSIKYVQLVSISHFDVNDLSEQLQLVEKPRTDITSLFQKGNKNNLYNAAMKHPRSQSIYRRLFEIIKGSTMLLIMK